MLNLVIYVLGALVGLVPFAFSPKSSELFEFPKLLLVYFGASLLFPILLFKLSQRGKWLLKNYKFLLLSVGLFLLSQGLSTVFSIDKHVSLFGYYSRFNGGLFSLLSYMVIALTALLFLSRERAESLLKILLVSGLAIALWGLPSHFGFDLICLLVLGQFNTSCWTNDFIPELRMFSTLGQPNWFATYLLVLILLVLYYIATGYRLLNNKNKQFNLFALLFMLFLFSVELVWTNSKSGILTYIIGVPLFFAGLFYLRRTKVIGILKNSYYLPIVIFIIVLLSQAITYLPKPVVIPAKQPAELSKQTETHITPSSDIRFIVWEGALKLGQKYPLFGTGVETFAYSYYFTRPLAHNLTSEWNFVYNKAHNELLNLLATSGVVGLLFYLIMFVTFLFPAFRLFFKHFEDEDDQNRVLALFYLLSMLSISLMNFFGFSTTATSLLTYLLPVMFLVMIRTQAAPEKSEDRVLRQVTLNQLAVYFIYLLFMFIYLLNYFAADYNYARGREYKQIQDFPNAYLFTEKALSLRREPTYLDQQAGMAANLAALSKIQKQNPQVIQMTKEAIKYNNESLKISPKNVFYYKTRAKIYYLLALTNIEDQAVASDYLNKALKTLEEAAWLAPTDPVIPYTHASLIMETNPDQATMLLEKALALKPNYEEAKTLLKGLQK